LQAAEEAAQRAKEMAEQTVQRTKETAAETWVVSLFVNRSFNKKLASAMKKESSRFQLAKMLTGKV
jgi:ABC-type Zn uptake system ZnuABC Zn-binding protein ZnuA